MLDWEKLWKQYEETNDPKEEQKLEDELRNIIQDVAEIRECSTSKAFNILMGWSE